MHVFRCSRLFIVMSSIRQLIESLDDREDCRIVKEHANIGSEEDITIGLEASNWPLVYPAVLLI